MAVHLQEPSWTNYTKFNPQEGWQSRQSVGNVLRDEVEGIRMGSSPLSYQGETQVINLQVSLIHPQGRSLWLHMISPDNCQREMNGKTLSQNSRTRGKSNHQLRPVCSPLTFGLFIQIGLSMKPAENSWYIVVLPVGTFVLQALSKWAMKGGRCTNRS